MTADTPSNIVLIHGHAFGNTMPLTPRAPTKVDFGRNDRAPLLFAAFGEDPGRPHFPAAPGWEEVADYALDWALRTARSS